MKLKIFKSFEFKYKKITATDSPVFKYVFEFMNSSTTTQVAEVLQKQVDLSKLKAEKVQKRSSHRPGVRSEMLERIFIVSLTNTTNITVHSRITNIVCVTHIECYEILNSRFALEHKHRYESSHESSLPKEFGPRDHMTRTR